MALKRQCPEVREREAQAMALKRQCPEVREREAQVKSLKRQCPEFREREAQAKALNVLRSRKVRSTCKEAEPYQAELYSP